MVVIRCSPLHSGSRFSGLIWWFLSAVGVRVGGGCVLRGVCRICWLCFLNVEVESVLGVGGLGCDGWVYCKVWMFVPVLRCWLMLKIDANSTRAFGTSWSCSSLVSRMWWPRPCNLCDPTYLEHMGPVVSVSGSVLLEPDAIPGIFKYHFCFLFKGSGRSWDCMEGDNYN